MGKTVFVTWWGWHFISMTVAADLFWQECSARFPSLPQGLGGSVIRLGVIFSAGAAANLFLLLALAALFPRHALLRYVYKARFLLDLVAAVVLLNVPQQSLLLYRVPFRFLFRFIFRQ